MKKVYLPYFQTRIHSQTRLMIENPPQGYAFCVPPIKKRKNLILFFAERKIIKYIYRRLIKKWFGAKSLYNALYLSSIPSDIDLVFTPNFIKTDKPFVIEVMDNPFCMEGYNYERFIRNIRNIQKILEAPNCRKIIVVNESSFKIIKRLFSKQVIKKTTLVRAAISEDNSQRDYTRISPTLLFLGSIANPDDFYIKGGLEALRSFNSISKLFPNARLIIRCKVPAEVKKSYKNIKNIFMLEKDLNQKEMNSLWEKADILISPAHHYVLMATLEAMSKGIPIVALDTWGVRDYLSDKCALLVAPSKKMGGYGNPSYPTNVRSESFTREIKNGDAQVISDLSNAVSALIKNPSLRRKLGIAARRIVKNKFSLSLRNKKLRKIFDEATKYSSQQNCLNNPQIAGRDE